MIRHAPFGRAFRPPDISQFAQPLFTQFLVLLRRHLSGTDKNRTSRFKETLKISHLLIAQVRNTPCQIKGIDLPSQGSDIHRDVRPTNEILIRASEYLYAQCLGNEIRLFELLGFRLNWYDHEHVGRRRRAHPKPVFIILKISVLRQEKPSFRATPFYDCKGYRLDLSGRELGYFLQFSPTHLQANRNLRRFRTVVLHSSNHSCPPFTASEGIDR